MSATSKYDTHVIPRLDEIEAWLRDGLTNKEIARRLGITERSLMNYHKAHPELKHIFRKNKEYVDKVEMVGAYKMRAQGYTVETTRRKYIYRIQPDGSQIKTLVSEEVKEVHVPGDARAMENWLRRRLPDEWGGDQVVEDSKDTGVIMLQEREDE